MEKMSLAPGPLHLLILFVANAQFQSRLFFLIYLFMAPLSLPCSVWTSFHWRQAGATLHCNVWALGVKSFSSYGLQAQSLWCTGSVNPMACRIFSVQGSNVCSSHWQADPSSLSHQGSPTSLSLLVHPGSAYMSPPEEALYYVKCPRPPRVLLHIQ